MAMKKRLFRLVAYCALLGIISLLGVLFLPRNYKVLEFTERPNTRYWDLKTGSRIGYQKIAADPAANNHPIIYLHGGPGGIVTNETIEMLAPLAKKNYDLYLYDQVGSGHSERLDNIEEYTVERHVEDLAEIIEAIGAEKVILLGQSWGAMLAMQYLAEHPQKVEKLIFTGPGPILPIRPELSKREIPDSLNLKSPKFSNKDGNRKAYNLRSRFVSYWATTFGKKLSTDQEADNFFTYLNGELSKSTKCDPSGTVESSGGRGYYAHIMTIRSFQKIEDKRNKIRGLEIPVLIIKGQCDNQKWEFVVEYLELLPNTRLEIIEGAGHIIGKEHQKRYLEEITKFLD